MNGDEVKVNEDGTDSPAGEDAAKDEEKEGADGEDEE
mgnify:CR=1 FL=1